MTDTPELPPPPEPLPAMEWQHHMFTADQLRAYAAEAVRVAQGWRPIETAPKDGTGFLGYIPSKRGYVARQDVCPMHWSSWGGGTWESSTSGHRIHDDVTRWMPLPAAPKDHT